MPDPQPMNVAPVTLAGSHVRLEPLSMAHVDALARVGLAPDLWRWVPTHVESVEEMREYVQSALDELAQGVSLPFAIVSVRGGEVIGSTRYGNISPANRRLEIGWTWIAPAHQRSPANTEAKLLLLRHAFERLGAIRVELKTDALNIQSRAAIVRIGAIEEGTFRHHLIVPKTGRVRDTVYYSILAGEWPALKARLTERLTRGS